MKRTLLLCGMLSTALFANAQQRLVLYEEFSGENCGPCAATNPPFWNFLNTAPNNTKVVLLKYQVNIPQASIHPLYDQNASEAEARRSYYGANSAPNGRIDGRLHHAGTTAPGHPGLYLNPGGQDSMNAEIAFAAPFNITMGTPTVTGNNFSVSVSVTAASAFTGTNMKLRAAMVESLHFPTPPGNNGEVDFHNVMRKMYPGPDGQAFPNTWTNGQNQSFTVTGTYPAYVDKAAPVLFLLVWIQDDGNKRVAQAAKTGNMPLPQFDGAITGSTPADGKMFCTVGAQPHKVTLKNTGSSPLTAAEIYYKVGTGAYQMYNWTGSLAAGASVDVSVGNITLTAGTVTVTDSVGKVNNQAEINPVNSVYKFGVTSYASANALPISSGFEGGFESGWAATDNTGKVIVNPPFRGSTWATFSDPDIKTPDNSSWTAVVSNADIPAGDVTNLILPYANMPAGAKALDFYYANAKRASVGDRMDIVYSTDCGANWTSIWNKSGDALANNPPTAEDKLLVPSAASQYRFVSVDMSAVTGNALIGFKSTSSGGNYIWLDKVVLRTGAVTGIEELVSGGNATLYPNPVADQVTVELNMTKSAKVSFQIVNMMGQQVGQPVVKDLTTGQTNTTIATNDLAPGIYFMNIATDKGSIQQKFVKK